MLSRASLTAQPNRFKINLALLPNDVLPKILENLPNEDLYGLALLCRALHHTALPLYLSRFSINNTTSFINLTAQASSLDALSGLRIALFISSTARIVCEIPQTDSRSSFRNLTRFKSLISRLSAVGHVTLHLRRWMYNTSFSKDESQGEKWNEFIEELCVVLVSKACSKLEVVNVDEGDRMSFTPLETQTKPGLWRELHRWKELKAHPGSKITQSPKRLLLTSIHIRSPNIFGFSHLQRGLPTLSSLQCLTLDCSSIWMTGWTDILTQISHTAPTISKIMVSTYIDAMDFIQFIGKLAHLTHLSVLFATLGVLPERFAAMPRLSSLTHLSTSPKYITTFLSSAALPKIQSIEIWLSINNLDSDLKSDQITRIFQRLTDMQSGVSLSLKIHIGGELTMKAYMIQHLDTSLEMGPKYGAPLVFIKSLSIVNFPLFSSSDVELHSLVFPRWLALFKTLQHITITGYTSDSYDILLQSIRTGCQHCSTVTVNDLFYSIGKTRSEDDSVTLTTFPSFLDIPDDVLDIIFNHLGVDVLAFANLSRRLRLLTLPIYLTHRKNANPTSVSTLTLDRDAHLTLADVSALRLSHTVSNIHHLHCTITSGKLFLVFEFFRRLCSLVDSLRSIEKITIKFNVARPRGSATEILWEKWEGLFSTFLVTCVKRHCVSLEVQGDFVFKGSELPLKTLLARTISLRINFTTLTIDSAILPQTPVLPWTILVLAHSTITRLEMTSLPPTSSELLPGLVHLLPVLADLYIGGPPIRPVDAMAFINNLPQLKYLNMSHSLSQGFLEVPFYPKSNPPLHLISLSAPPQFITLFLSSPAILPKLESLTIVPRPSGFPMAFFPRIAKCLESLGCPLLRLTIEGLPDQILTSTCQSFITACPSLVTLHANGLDQPIHR